jgi:hypothetical protein
MFDGFKSYTLKFHSGRFSENAHHFLQKKTKKAKRRVTVRS